MAAFLGTLFYSVEVGLAIAVGLAVLIALYHAAFPHTAVLGKLPGMTVYRNVDQYPDSQVGRDWILTLESFTPTCNDRDTMYTT